MKRMILTLIAWSCGHFPAFAQDVVLSLREALAQPGDTVAVVVEIDTRAAVSGVAFDLVFDAAVLSYVGVEVTDVPFEVYAQTRVDGVRLIFLDPEAGGKLEAGEHLLVMCRLAVAAEGAHLINMANITATDGGLPPGRLNSRGIGAAITATSNALYPAQTHWISRDSLRVDIALRNGQAVSALQLQVRLPGLAGDVRSLGRTDGWSAFINDASADGVRVVMADFSGANPIPSGDGSILQIQMAWIEGSDPVIEMVEAMATDAAGNQIPVMLLSGNVDVGNRPEHVVMPEEIADPSEEAEGEETATVEESVDPVEDTPMDSEDSSEEMVEHAPADSTEEGEGTSGGESADAEDVPEYSEDNSGDVPESAPGEGVADDSSEDAEIAEVMNTLYLSAAQWISRDSLQLELSLHNEQAISGLQLTLPLSVMAVGVSGMGRASTWASFMGQTAQGVRVVAIDFSGTNPISAGDGAVLNLRIHWPAGDSEVSLALDGADVVATNAFGHSVPVAVRSGAVTLADRPEGIDQVPVRSNPGVRIVEILADPSSGTAGDANGDGVRHSSQDEFVELLNEGTVPVDISGWFLGDDDVDTTRMFRFAPGTVLQPGERVVLFGGGQPQGDFGRFFVDDGSIGNGLTNSGDVILLLAPGGVDTMDMAVFPQASGQSLVREGNSWMPHKDGVRNVAFSPGKPRPSIEFAFPQPAQVEVQVGKTLKMKAFAYYSDREQVEIPGSEPLWVARDTSIVRISADGNVLVREVGQTDVWFAFRGRESLHAEIAVTSAQPSAPQSDASVPGPVTAAWTAPEGLVISEIFPDPGTGDDGDANGDGVRHTYEDEFVELANLGEEAVDLSGWYLGDDDVAASRLFRFPPGTVLQPGEYATLFGGGVPTGIPGFVFTDDGRIGDGLANAGDGIRLIAPDGQTVVLEAVFEQGKRGVSWTRHDAGDFVLHNDLPGMGPFSPGRPQPRLSKVRLEPDEIPLIEGESIAMIGWGLFDSGDSLALGDGVLWRSSQPEVAQVQDGKILGLSEGVSTVSAFWHNVLSNEIRVVVGLRITSGTDSTRIVKQDSIAQDGIPEWRLDGLVVSEIYAAPGAGLSGDANGDGVRHTYEDEFVEVLNAGSESLDLSGWGLSDGDGPFDRMFRFPPGTVLLPGQYATLFGGGNATGIPGLVFVDNGRIGDGLANAGDVVRLISPDGQTEAFQIVFPPCKEGVSWVRDETGNWRLHNELPGKGNRSPGRAQPVLTDLVLVPDVWVLEVGKEMFFEVLAVFGDGDTLSMPEGFSWNTLPDSLIAISKDRVRGLAAGQGIAQVVYGNVASQVAEVRVVSAEESVADAMPDRPAFLSTPDTTAVLGLSYRYRPRVRDAVDLTAVGLPDWLIWENGAVVGMPEGVEKVAFDMVATNGAGTRVQRVQVQVVAPQALTASLNIEMAHSGLTWRQKLAVPPGVQVQVDGGPEWHPETQELIWKPIGAQRGVRRVTIGFSSSGAETVFTTLEIEMRPMPQVVLVELLQAPLDDANGDGRIDPYEDQFLVIQNTSPDAIDLSGWLLGDDDREPAPLPKGIVLHPGERLTLFGLCDEALPLRLSAGGRIGNGLARSDRILLIAPAGPDTVIDERYQADQPGMSLVKNALGKWEYKARIGEALAGGSKEEPKGAEVSADLEMWLKPVPNPFHTQTTMGFFSAGGQVRVTVYSVLGQPVRRLVHRQLPVGYYQRIWDGTNDDGQALGSGIYLVRLENAQAVYTHRVALLR